MEVLLKLTASYFPEFARNTYGNLRKLAVQPVRRKLMKIAIASLFAAFAFAQSVQAAPPAACGPGDVRFVVKLDKSQHTLKQPEPGKALVYFFQDSMDGRVGLDGAWVGAVRGHSYFSVSVEPGEHHLCVRVDAPQHPFELEHFTAEAGRVYYFRGRVVPAENGNYLFVDQPNSDESQDLLSAYSLAVWKALK